VSTYYWDFFGPNAERTADHFRRHLEGFLRDNGCDGCATGVESQGAGHFAAYCTASEQHEPLIERALKPRRKL
jgi:uncharacterized protein